MAQAQFKNKMTVRAQVGVAWAFLFRFPSCINFYFGLNPHSPLFFSITLSLPHSLLNAIALEHHASIVTLPQK